MHSEEVLEKEIREVKAKIQQEIENDDDDDAFILVTKGRRGKAKVYKCCILILESHFALIYALVLQECS